MYTTRRRRRCCRLSSGIVVFFLPFFIFLTICLKQCLRFLHKSTSSYSSSSTMFFKRTPVTARKHEMALECQLAHSDDVDDSSNELRKANENRKRRQGDDRKEFYSPPHCQLNNYCFVRVLSFFFDAEC